MASDMAGLHCLFQRVWFLVTLISSVTLRFYELLQVLHCDPLSSAGYWTGEGLALQTKLSWCFPHFPSSTLHIFKIYDQRNLWKWQYTNISGPKLLKFDPAPVFCVLQCVCTLQRLIDRCVRSKLLHAVESIIIVFIIFFFIIDRNIAKVVQVTLKYSVWLYALKTIVRCSYVYWNTCSDFFLMFVTCKWWGSVSTESLC